MYQIVNCKIPSLDTYGKVKGKNERDILHYNLKLLNETNMYLDSCIEVLRMIILKKAHLSLTKEDMNLMKIYLDQSRFKASNIIAIAQNYIIKTKEDMRMLRTFEEKAFGITDNNEDIYIMNNNKVKYGNIENDIKRKMDRVDHVLNISHRKIYSIDFMEKKRQASLELYKENRASIIHSNLLTQVLKYVNKPVRERIITSRISERYKSNEQSNDYFI